MLGRAFVCEDKGPTHMLVLITVFFFSVSCQLNPGSNAVSEDCFRGPLGRSLDHLVGIDSPC